MRRPAIRYGRRAQAVPSIKHVSSTAQGSIRPQLPWPARLGQRGNFIWPSTAPEPSLVPPFPGPSSTMATPLSRSPEAVDQAHLY
jgi:hypothetical protein